MLPERYIDANPSLLRDVMDAAEESGFSIDERRDIIRHPENWQSRMSSALQPAFTPEHVEAFVHAIAGHLNEQEMQSLRNLRGILYRYKYSFRNEEEIKEVAVTTEDQRILSMAVHYIERGLYNGTLVGLEPDSRAALSGTVNRIGKIKEHLQKTAKVDNFDYGRFKRFVKRVTSFAHQYLGEEWNTEVKYDHALAWQTYQGSKNHVQEKMAFLENGKTKSRSQDMFMVKDMLVADSMRDQSLPGVFIPDTHLPPEGMAEYNFLAPLRERKKPTDSAYPWIHYDTRAIPFSKFAVEYLRATKKKQDT